MNQQPVIQLQRGQDAWVVNILCDEFDFQRTKQFKSEFEKLQLDDAKQRLILDLSQVGFMPSVTLGALVELRSRFAREQRPFMLVGIQPAMVTLMQACGMLQMFEIRDDVYAALDETSDNAQA
jgi:anti-anti-sigma factor